MSVFSAGRLTTSTTNNTAAIEIINPSAAAKPAYIKRITVSLNAATATLIVLGRPAAAGVTPTSPQATQDEEGKATGVVTTALAWGTSPTPPTVPMRQHAVGATIGATAWFEFFGRGVRLDPGQTFVIHNVGTVSAMAVSVEIEQDIRVVA